ncbi:divalent-cation tolerance protein CutA [Pseudodesulfovibrio thermohalotolerans]|uniref:divalent-cation tolerance protein CutA n=1 Tax=Pseudodesulfovibrio thermohalotolerans TaxID=2880651 RepID=UPI0024417B1B|nr:divalent-cation tolerance protein CutA [Pseudodesulfovibrio thermohalotolerans]WFS61051.1 divalent-cation tolerance protein CutA [Pseudodesulfovibrio thermohalotolerans]
MSESFIYITCADEFEAETVGSMLVERRLAACVNILPGMKSIYWWQGKLERGKEVVLIAKTRTELVDTLTEAVKGAHGYEVPCVVAMPISGGNQDFLAWIRSETAKS